MAKQRDSKAAPRIPLSRDRVLRAAIQLADDSGIESLTMRKLGQAVGVEAMSLYNHVTNKDDILDGIVDVVVGEIEVPPSGADWKTAMRRRAISAHEVLLRHPWACNLLVSRFSKPGPARLRYMDSILGRLRGAGFSAEMTHHAFHALDNHILGYTMQELNFPFSSDELAEVGESFLRSISATEYPHLVEHVKLHLEPAYDDDGEFEFGLDLILDGIERARDRD